MSCAGCRFGYRVTDYETGAPVQACLVTNGYLGAEAGDAVREAWRKLDQPGASLNDIETCPQRQPGPPVYAPSEQ